MTWFDDELLPDCWQENVYTDIIINEANRTLSTYEDQGLTSWELDALTPQAIDGLVTTAVRNFIDEHEWDAVLERQRQIKKKTCFSYKDWNDGI